MKMLLPVAALAIALSSLTGCQSCGDQNPCDDDRMLGMGMFHKKHFGFGHGRKDDCDACGPGPVLDGRIGQAPGCGCNAPSAMMPVSTSGGCDCNSGAVHGMPVSLNSGTGALPPGTIVTESVPTPAPSLGGGLRGANPGLPIPGPD
jgi:hypothetical protein